MRPLRTRLLAIACVLAAPAWPLAAAPAPLETLSLLAPGENKIWSPVESSLAWENPPAGTAAAATPPPAGAAASTLHWHVPIDHTTGEPKYPVGWPRFSRAFPAGPLRDWSAWDYLRLRVYCATNRAALPRDPVGLGLHTPDRARAYQRALTELRPHAWTEILLPITAIPRSHDVRQLQLHVAEERYRHGDHLDLYLAELALVRHAAPTWLAFAPASAVAFADAGHLAVQASIAGVRPDAPADIICELRRADRVVARTTAPAQRGAQTLDLHWDRTAPPPAGDYTLVATLQPLAAASPASPATPPTSAIPPATPPTARPAATTSAPVRLVTSPWQ